MTFAFDRSRDARFAVAALADREVVIDGASRVPAMFDARFVDALGIESAGPVVRISALDAVHVTHGSTVDMDDGTRYLVRGMQPDGAGVTALVLEKQ